VSGAEHTSAITKQEQSCLRRTPATTLLLLVRRSHDVGADPGDQRFPNRTIGITRDEHLAWLVRRQGDRRLGAGWTTKRNRPVQADAAFLRNASGVTTVRTDSPCAARGQCR
jgi:hypothetical protein